MSPTSNEQIVLYDIPSKGRCSCWSPNTWKTRLALNYKNLSYKTEWVEYPDIAPRLSALGIPPNPTGAWANYTCPAIRLPDGRHIMDSETIAHALEDLQPEPSLHIDRGIHKDVHKALLAVIGALRPRLLPAVQRGVLREPSASWFADDRARRFGKSLDQLEHEEGGEKAWNAVKPALDGLKSNMEKHCIDDGPFVLGSVVSYGDFLVAGVFEWIRRADVGLFEKIITFSQVFKSHHEACGPWLARDDN